MKICHVVGSSSFGGGSRVVLALASDMASRGHDVHVVATDAEFATILESVDVDVRPLSHIRRPVNPVIDLWGFMELANLFRQERYDLVHTHTSKGGVLGRLAARVMGVPRIVHTVHGFAFHEQSGRVARAVYTWIERVAARWCDTIVTVSEHHRDVALELGIGRTAQVIAIQNGIEGVHALSSGSNASQSVMIRAMGRLSAQKGFEYLIDACRDLRDRGKSFRCEIAGDGPMKQQLVTRIKKWDLDGVVELVGFVRDPAAFYTSADVVALPSLWEGLSIALLEAMSAGCCIVTTEIPSAVEVIGQSECACLVPAKDSEALAVALSTVMDDVSLRRSLGEKARARFMEAFSLSGMLEKYRRVYGVENREQA